MKALVLFMLMSGTFFLYHPNCYKQKVLTQGAISKNVSKKEHIFSHPTAFKKKRKKPR